MTANATIKAPRKINIRKRLEAIPTEALIDYVLDALEERAKYGDALSSPQAVKDWLRVRIAELEHEAFVVVFLDTQNRVIAFEELFRGTLAQAAVYPREVVKAALRHNAGGVILAHNHPSGNAEPSQSDQTLTEALKRALSTVDVRVLDHFIVTPKKVTSFAERGLI